MHCHCTQVLFGRLTLHNLFVFPYFLKRNVTINNVVIVSYMEATHVCFTCCIHNCINTISPEYYFQIRRFFIMYSCLDPWQYLYISFVYQFKVNYGYILVTLNGNISGSKQHNKNNTTCHLCIQNLCHIATQYTLTMLGAKEYGT